MPNNVLASVDNIIANPGDARCSGFVYPQGGGNPVLFTAVWNYGDAINTITNAIRTAIGDAMASVGLPLQVNDKVTVFGGPLVL